MVLRAQYIISELSNLFYRYATVISDAHTMQERYAKGSLHEERTVVRNVSIIRDDQHG